MSEELQKLQKENVRLILERDNLKEKLKKYPMTPEFYAERLYQLGALGNESDLQKRKLDEIQNLADDTTTPDHYRLKLYKLLSDEYYEKEKEQQCECCGRDDD